MQPYTGFVGLFQITSPTLIGSQHCVSDSHKYHTTRAKERLKFLLFRLGCCFGKRFHFPCFLLILTSLNLWTSKKNHCWQIFIEIFIYNLKFYTELKPFYRQRKKKQRKRLVMFTGVMYIFNSWRARIW